MTYSTKYLLVFILTFCLFPILSGCKTINISDTGLGNKYQYYYSLALPAKSSNLQFRDDRIIIQFRLDDAAINFQLQNISLEEMRIDWEKAAIGIDQKYFPVKNEQTMYSKDDAPKLGPAIPSYGYLIDFAIPEQSMVFDGQKWCEREMLRTTDRNSSILAKEIQDNVNSRIKFILPLVFDSESISYTFEFAVDSVGQILWDDYKKPNRNPPEASIEKQSMTTEEILTAAIVTISVIGVTIYLATKNREQSEGL